MNPITCTSIATALGGRRAVRRRGCGLYAGFTALSLALFVQSAAAGDLGSALRGSFSSQFSTPSYADWSGIYFGGQLGLSNMNADFRRQHPLARRLYSAQDACSKKIPTVELEDLPSSTTNGRQYGAFLGYNCFNGINSSSDSTWLTIDSRSLDTSVRAIISRGKRPPRTILFTNDVPSLRNRRGPYDRTYATLRARAGMPSASFALCLRRLPRSAAPTMRRSATVIYQRHRQHDQRRPTPKYGPLISTIRYPTPRTTPSSAASLPGPRHGRGAAAERVPARGMGIHRLRTSRRDSGPT